MVGATNTYRSNKNILKILVVKSEANVHLLELRVNGKINAFIRVAV